MTRRGGILIMRRAYIAQDYGDGWQRKLAHDRKRIADLARRIGKSKARCARMLADRQRATA